MSGPYWRPKLRVMNQQRPAERDAPQAPRAPSRDLTVRYIYSDGRRYVAYDANQLVDRLSELENRRQK